MEVENLKILAIDDNSDNLTTLKALLQDTLPRVRIFTALNGPTGLKLARDENPDVILLDLVMPGMNGFEVCRALKSEEQLRFTPVLILTALKTDRSSRLKALEEGAEAFLSKPIDELELVAQIRAMVKIKAAGDRQRLEKNRLAELVAERTRELEIELAERRKAVQELQQTNLQLRQNQNAMLNLMEDLKAEIEARKRAEESLRTSEGYLSNALQMAKLGHWEYDVDADLFTFSDEFYALFRTSAGKVGGYSLPSARYAELFLHPDDQPLVAAETRKAIETTEPDYSRKLEHRIIYADGEIGTISVSFHIKKDQAGRTIKTFGVNQDITERIKGEEERKAIEAQLRQAQKMEAIGTLAGGVAHDFNNMLGAILGSVDLALMDVESYSPLYGNLMQIRQAARRSTDLTRQILAFARKQTASPRNLDFNKEIVRILEMLKPLIEEDVSLIWKPGENLGSVRMDPAQVDQVLTNLIVNARDAIPGVGTIVIETANQTLDEEFCLLNPGAVPGKYVRVSVNDTGAGIAPEILPHIFEPFFTTKGVGQGTGMGLSTVFGIIKQNGGYVTVSSRSGDGTSFHIYLPRATAEAAADPLPTEARPGRCGNETVLLVEDEEQILDTGKIILERHGYSVLVAKHPEEGLRLFEAHEAELALLITDVIMPGMSGRELWERLSARKPGLKCLFVSGYPAEVIATRGLLERGLHFIQKPFSLSEFTEKVREVLDGEGDTG